MTEETSKNTSSDFSTYIKTAVDISKCFFINLTLEECISLSSFSNLIVFRGVSRIIMMLSDVTMTLDINRVNIMYV